jgi:hypothetical protein
MSQSSNTPTGQVLNRTGGGLWRLIWFLNERWFPPALPFVAWQRSFVNPETRLIGWRHDTRTNSTTCA